LSDDGFCLLDDHFRKRGHDDDDDDGDEQRIETNETTMLFYCCEHESFCPLDSTIPMMKYLWRKEWRRIGVVTREKMDLLPKSSLASMATMEESD
jgi:hypothetical protein